MLQRKRKRNRWLIGGLIIGAAILGISFLTMETYSVYFYTPAEAQTQAAKLSARDIRVGGMVKASSVQWNKANVHLAFVLTDLKDTEITVVHEGAPPDMFKENSGVVAEGRLSADGKTLTARHLLVKHSEEYKIPDHKMLSDTALLQKSIIKDEVL